MGKNVFFIFLLLTSIGGLKSQTLIFEYEDGGNQVIRQYCATCSPTNKSANKTNLVDKKEFPPAIYQVKIYPNPTKDKANLVWSPELGDMIQKVEYVAYNFTQYREIPFNKRENKVTLDLSDQPIGMYIVIFHLNTGEKLTYKVLKQ
ncbi:T9SS type A sorting domain-containing protein [Chryseobacterium sp. SG20098]|uniref:T9SS type A sorting domain-containing protein n=1 Tax=Chryseobacterium sp. SG20098 TaxID=3074145 RepID=UPI0028833534|nr:T9SS type A sorting domain-containing protein [Chryseobacterium sp. SG20098]WNI34719.1 T9SS type A sorting domain-containing protein [Chryseobacterium sp. SG20098]